MVLLACLLAQGTAVQSHIHFTPAARSAPGGQAVHAAGTETGSDAADCPLCQEAAMAGAYLLPAAISLPPAPPRFVWVTTAKIGQFDLLAPALGWLSRAPPR